MEEENEPGRNHPTEKGENTDTDTDTDKGKLDDETSDSNETSTSGNRSINDDSSDNSSSSTESEEDEELQQEASGTRSYKEALVEAPPANTRTPLEMIHKAHTEARQLGIENERRPQTRNSYMPQYLETTTLEVWAKDGKAHGIEELLNEIDNLEYDKSQQMRGIQEIDRRLGKFKITFKGNKEMKEVRQDWIDREEEDTKWTPIIRTEQAEEFNTFTLQGIPMEYPLEMTREYLKKYVEKPEIHRATLPGRPHLFNGDIKVEHQGLKMKIDNRIWVGPNISAWVKGLTQRPMAEWRPKCGRCQELGHLATNCENSEKCRKCKGEGHQAHECEWCKICRKNGHKTGNCLHNPEATSPDQNENTENRQIREKQRQTERDHQMLLQQVKPQRQQTTEQPNMNLHTTDTRYDTLMDVCPECNGLLEKGKCKLCNLGGADTNRDIRTSTPQATELTNPVNFSQHVAKEKKHEQETRKKQEKENKRKSKKEVKQQEKTPQAKQPQEESERESEREREERRKRRTKKEEARKEREKEREKEIGRKLEEERKEAVETLLKEQEKKKEKDKRDMMRKARRLKEKEERQKKEMEEQNKKATKRNDQEKKNNETEKEQAEEITKKTKDIPNQDAISDVSMANKVSKLTAHFENSIREETIKTTGKRQTEENSWSKKNMRENKKPNKDENAAMLQRQDQTPPHIHSRQTKED